MKTRNAALSLALCLLSALSFADSTTDAPLTVSDPYAAVQANQSASTAKAHIDKKKNKECAAQQAAKSKDKKQHRMNTPTPSSRRPVCSLECNSEQVYISKCPISATSRCMRIATQVGPDLSGDIQISQFPDLG